MFEIIPGQERRMSIGGCSREDTAVLSVWLSYRKGRLLNAMVDPLLA